MSVFGKSKKEKKKEKKKENEKIDRKVDEKLTALKAKNNSINIDGVVTTKITDDTKPQLTDKEKQQQRVADAQKAREKKMTDLVSSFLLFFAIPLLVCSIKILTIFHNMINTTQVFEKGEDKYDGFIFMIIIFISIFAIVKDVLGDTQAFIYVLFACMAIFYKAYILYID